EGMDKFNATAHAMGITSPLDDNPAEVLGGLTVGVTPLEMADADATLSNGGSHVAATVIGKVVFPDGSVRDFGNPHHTPVFPYEEAYAGTSVLKQVITTAGATGTAANYGCPAAGKTGTAENLANAWFVGYTPRMSTAVWVGNPHGNVPMINGFGGVLAAPIWRDYMHPASGDYCGNWNPPPTSFQGTAFFGPHSATGSASTIASAASSAPAAPAIATGAAPTPTGGTGAVTETSTSPANNPPPKAHPPHSSSGTTPSHTTPSGTGGAAATGGHAPKKH
ncbi:MAG: penicillin-binding transpeptidase domain-containing protein, partial [Solirubrobacteraceae bacterium]